MNSDLILTKRFMQAHSKVAARALADIDSEKLAIFFNDTPIEWLLNVIPHMNPQWMSETFERMNQETLIQLFESMEINHLLAAIRMMNKDLAGSILNRLSEGKSASVKRLLHYLDHSIGAHMDPEVFTLSENLMVKEALSVIKKHKERVQPQLFVTNAERKLVGVMSLSDLIARNPGLDIKSLMITKITTLSPETPIQSVLTHQGWQEFYALPVVDNASLFLGAIKLETIRAILAQSSSKEEEMGQLTISALGELYRLGLAGLIRTATDTKPLSKE